MKTLYVIRHAKSSWAEPWMSDFERPLNERGKKDAPEMAARLKMKSVVPDLVVSSPAKRAQKTALAFAEVLGYAENNIVYLDEIYEAHIHTIYDVVQHIEASADVVLLFGHNPTLTYFVNELASVHIDNIPTCGIAAIGLAGEWKDVREGTGKLIWFDYPKNI